MTDREEFEAWFASRAQRIRQETFKVWSHDNSLYQSEKTQDRWDAWQAARQSQAEEINRLKDAIQSEADYCMGYANKYAKSDPARSKRHKERCDRLRAVLGDHKNSETLGWQPIATAPKDQRILVRTENEVYAAHWAKNPITDDEAWIVAEWGTEGDQALVKSIEWRHISQQSEMTEEKAREILGGPELSKVAGEIVGKELVWIEGCQEVPDTITWSLEQLKALVWWMEHKSI